MRDGGQLVVECLARFGATKAFGVPGESYLPILNALYETKGTLDFITCRHEGGASFMAAAWGKLTGTPGICLVTRGPGATNAAIGIHTARQDSVPLILLVGQVSTAHLDREAFQEVDYRQTFKDLAKWVVQIDQVDRIPELLSRAWKTALTGRPGPVVVVLPEDVLSHTSPIAPAPPPRATLAPALGAEFTAPVRDALARARRPLILIGPGQETDPAIKQDLAKFAEANHLPVVCAFRCQDAFDNTSASYVGEAGVAMPAHVRKTLDQADFILAINVRFGEMTTGAYEILTPALAGKTLIHTHCDDFELGKVCQADFYVRATKGQVAAALRHIRVTADFAPWCRQRRTAHEHFLTTLTKTAPVDMVAVTRHLQTTLPPDALITNGAGNFAFWPNKVFTYGHDMRLLAPQSGAMGYGLPAAIAAKIHSPEKTVVCFAGDGDFLMTAQELATAAQFKARPLILILNNCGYGTIKMHQEQHYPGRPSGTALENPDFVALARAYGFSAQRIEHTHEFAPAFDTLLRQGHGGVLELNIGN